MFDQGLENTVPALLERCHPMSWDWHPSVLSLGGQVRNLDLVKLNGGVLRLALLLDGLHLCQLSLKQKEGVTRAPWTGSASLT